MVQKEVGERFAAKPGTRRLRRAVGARPARVRRASVLRPISRTVFHPVPNVDSVLVGLERRGPAPDAGAARARAAGAFAHRRKALARSRRRSRRRRRVARPRARGARGARPAGRRPRRAPRAGASGARCTGGARDDRCARPARSTSPCSSARRARDGLHPLVSVVQAVTLADELTDGCRRTRDEVVCPGVEGPNLARRRARRASARRPAGTTAAADHDRQAHPGRRRDGRRLGRRGRGRCASPRAPPAASTRRCLHEVAVRDRRRRPGAARPRPRADGRRRRARRPPAPTPSRSACVIVPSPATLSTPAVYASSTGSAPPAPEVELAARKDARRVAGDRRRPSTTSRTPRARCARRSTRCSTRCAATGADHAMVSGSGPTVFGCSHDAEHGARRGGRSSPGAIAAEPAAMKWGWLLGAVALAGVPGRPPAASSGAGLKIARLGRRRGRRGSSARAWSRCRTSRSCSRTPGETLGKWTYLLVGVLAFLETGAFVGFIAPGRDGRDRRRPRRRPGRRSRSSC